MTELFWARQGDKIGKGSSSLKHHSSVLPYHHFSHTTLFLYTTFFLVLCFFLQATFFGMLSVFSCYNFPDWPGSCWIVQLFQIWHHIWNHHQEELTRHYFCTVLTFFYTGLITSPLYIKRMNIWALQ